MAPQSSPHSVNPQKTAKKLSIFIVILNAVKFCFKLWDKTCILSKFLFILYSSQDNFWLLYGCTKKNLFLLFRTRISEEYTPLVGWMSFWRKITKYHAPIALLITSHNLCILRKSITVSYTSRIRIR